MRASGEFAGRFDIRLRGAKHPGEAGFGYRLQRVVWGQGYATEGVRVLLGKGFTALRLRRIVASTYRDNRASRRVMEKVGMASVRS